MIGLGAIFAQTAGGSSGSTQLSTPTLSATVQSNGGVLLQSSSVTNADGYVFERSPDEFFDVSGNITEVADSSARTITDGGLTYNQTYFYRVKATDSGATYTDSNYSSIKQVDLNILEVPTSFTATAGDTEVSLSWDAVVDATQYLVQRDTNSSFTSPTNVYSSSGISTTDTGLTNGTLYYYRIKAQGVGIADSPYSSNVSATPTAPASELPTFTADILDSVTETPRVAYSLTRLYSTYTGSCVKVRRSVDDLTTDIPFCNGIIHEDAVIDFCGSASGFVDTWYDQSGNGYDLVAASSGVQPVIYNGSSMIKNSDGNLAMLFDGVDDTLANSAATTAFFNDNLFSLSVVEPNDTIANLSGKPWASSYRTGGTGTRYGIGFYNSGGTPSVGIVIRDESGVTNNFYSNTSSNPVGRNGVYSFKFTNINNPTGNTIYDNGTSVTVIDGGSMGNGTTDGMAIGSRGDRDYFKGYVTTHIDFDNGVTEEDTLRSYFVDNFTGDASGVNDLNYKQDCALPVPDDPLYTAALNRSNTEGYTAPSTANGELYKAMLSDISYYGIDSSADLMMVWLNDASEGFSFINLMDATGTLASKTGTVTWTDSSGIAGDGATGYVTLPFNPSTATYFSQDSASIFVAVRNVKNDASFIFGMNNGTDFIDLQDDASSVTFAINGPVSTYSGGSLPSDGIIELTRTNSTEQVLTLEGVVTDIDASTSVVAANKSLLVFADDNNGSTEGFSDCTVDFILIGSGDLNAKADIIRAIWNNYYNDFIAL